MPVGHLSSCLSLLILEYSIVRKTGAMLQRVVNERGVYTIWTQVLYSCVHPGPNFLKAARFRHYFVILD